MRTIKKVIRGGIIIAVLIGVVVAGVWLFAQASSKSVEYKTEKVTRGSIKQLVTANGQLNPTVVANVGTQVSGLVVKLHVDVNDQVTKGQLIAEIDPALLLEQLKQSESSLEIARINFEQAGRDYERSKELFRKNYVAKVEVERAEQSYISQKLSYEASKARLEQDKINIAFTKIRSPIDGVVIAKEITEGQTVQSSFQAPTLFKIAASLVDMKIDVTVPESDIGQLKVGMPVNFTVDAYPDREFVGELASININPNNSQLVIAYSVEVLLKNEEKLLFPGMTAYVNITLEEVNDVLKAPSAAFRFTPPEEKESAFKNLFNPTTKYRRWRSDQSSFSEPSVYVLRNGQLEEVKVFVGMMDERYAEIISDQIKEGDEVVLGIIEEFE